VKTVSQIICHSTEQLSKLVSNENMLTKIKHELTKMSFFKAHSDFYRLIKFSQSILYLSVSNAALATQLRHATPQILRELQEKLPDIDLKAIQCKVGILTAPIQKENVYQKLKTKKMSEKTRIKLSELSKTISSESLREALKRLSSRK